MRFGTICTWRDDVESYLDEVRTAEELGFELVTTGDSQSLTRDVYVALALAARDTTTARLGPMCTNPVTRHLAVTANAIATIDRLSNGRAVLGVGTGDSALRNIGQRPARVVEMESFLDSWRTLFASGRCQWGGAEMRVRGLRRAVPTFLTAEGPRMLRLAGALADGVVLHGGTSPDAVARMLGEVRAGAGAVGRDPAEIEVWMMLKTSVGDSRAEALDGIKMGLAASAHHAFRHSLDDKGVPARFHDAVRELILRYDASDHEVAGGRNAELSDALGLTDFLADTFGLVGTPAECVGKLSALERCGVDGVLLPALGTDPRGLIEQLGTEVIARMPGVPA